MHIYTYSAIHTHRYVFNEMNHRFPTLPFTLRALEDEKQARMGVVECLKHDLLHPYPVRVCFCLFISFYLSTSVVVVIVIVVVPKCSVPAQPEDTKKKEHPHSHPVFLPFPLYSSLLSLSQSGVDGEARRHRGARQVDRVAASLGHDQSDWLALQHHRHRVGEGAPGGHQGHPGYLLQD